MSDKQTNKHQTPSTLTTIIILKESLKTIQRRKQGATTLFYADDDDVWQCMNELKMKFFSFLLMLMVKQGAITRNRKKPNVFFPSKNLPLMDAIFWCACTLSQSLLVCSLYNGNILNIIWP